MKFNISKHLSILIILTLAVTFSQCGDRKAAITNPDDQIILIIDNTFVPNSLTVSPGDEIFFMNNDNIPHQILSQSAENIFDDTGLFESLIIPNDQLSSVIIPEDALPGTTLFFYDGVLLDQMSSPNGSFVVE